MPKLKVENYFSTSLANTVTNSVVWEIEFQLSVVPSSDYWYLIVDYETNEREEIFYHRKAGTSVFVYGINRVNPQPHDIQSSVQMNDSASIFNYITWLLPDHFFIYKTSTTTCHIRWGKVYDNGEYYTIADEWAVTLVTWTNYLYVEDKVIKSTLSTLTDKFVFWEIIVDWVLNVTSFETYNTLWLITWRTSIILKGSGIPSVSLWEVDDFYIDQDTSIFYWPKTTIWGSWISLKGEPWNNWVSPTVEAWVTTTWLAWTEAQVTNSWSANAAIFDFVIPKGDKWIQWDIWAAAPETEATINTNTTTTAVITSDWTTHITLTYGDTSYTKYGLTNILTVDKNWETTRNKSIVWSFTVPDTSWITYVDWLFIDKITWTSSFVWTPLYRDFDNTINWFNLFKSDTSFEWQVSMVYKVNAWEVLHFDADLWLKQWFNFDSWAIAMTFWNIVRGTTLTFAITVNVSDVTLTIWNVYTKDIIPVLLTNYVLGETSIPVLWTWTHIFVAEIFSTWLHLSYAWKSTAL